MLGRVFHGLNATASFLGVATSFFCTVSLQFSWSVSIFVPDRFETEYFDWPVLEISLPGKLSSSSSNTRTQSRKSFLASKGIESVLPMTPQYIMAFNHVHAVRRIVALAWFLVGSRDICITIILQ